jgi:hypothetical protein
MFSQEKADIICARLAEGESLNAICKDADMPAESTVRSWALDDVHGFSANYARAREIGYEKHAEQIIDLADEARIGVKITRKADGGIEEVEGDMVERSRLQIDARKWILAKMLPKKYGDKLDLAHSGTVGVRQMTWDVVDTAEATQAGSKGV